MHTRCAVTLGSTTVGIDTGYLTAVDSIWVWGVMQAAQAPVVQRGHLSLTRLWCTQIFCLQDSDMMPAIYKYDPDETKTVLFMGASLLPT